MKCCYCGTEMSAIDVVYFKRWKCPDCKHTELESCFNMLADEPMIRLCDCKNCKDGKPRLDKKFVFIVENAYCGQGLRIKAVIKDVPASHIENPDWWYLNKIDYTGCLKMKPIPIEKWGGVEEDQ